MTLRSLCVYCGSSPGRSPLYREAAEDFGRRLAQAGITLVYGGGNVGLMGTVADAALAEGGRVLGVIPQALAAKEVAHLGLTELQVVSSMHERKMKMAELSDGFVALPGGIGTLEEIFEVSTWMQLGIHAKPCAFLNVAGFYDHLLQFIQVQVEAGFLKPEHFDPIIFESYPAALLDRLQTYEHRQIDKWIDRPSRPGGVEP